MKRRTLIRLLVGLGIGIPLLVESVTFFGLLEAQFLGPDGPDTSTPAWTPEADAVGVSDELLEATAQTETLSTTSLVAKPNERVLTLTVRVDNPTNDSYELQLHSIETGDGETIESGASTGTVPPGENGVVTDQWTLDRSAYPRSVSVTAIVESDGGTERIEETVSLKRIPIEE